MAVPEKDKRGYYGLIVKPNFEAALGWARKGIRVPLPDRAAKWYALSPFRGAILDAEQKFQDFEHAVHDYRATGNELPEAAARVKSSSAGEDSRFGYMNDQAQELDELHGQQRVREVHEEHERRSAQQERYDELFQRHRQGRKNPIMENEDDPAIHFSIGSDDEEPNPASYGALRHRKHRGSMGMPPAAGRTISRQFPSFREANGQVRRHEVAAAAAVRPGENETYEAARRLVAADY